MSQTLSTNLNVFTYELHETNLERFTVWSSSLNPTKFTGKLWTANYKGLLYEPQNYKLTNFDVVCPTLVYELNMNFDSKNNVTPKDNEIGI